MKLELNVCFNESQTSSKIVHLALKVGHNVCLDDISNECGNGSCWLKTRSQGHIIEKPMGIVIL